MRAFLLMLISLDPSSLIIHGDNSQSQVEVRSVLINCEPDERDDIVVDNEATRFEREELFKHSILQKCDKKIVLTVKITSEPNQSSGDEYIPIEHVFRGPNKRVRLLNPYVLRLHRELPLQAYKLRRMDTVHGVFTNANDRLEPESELPVPVPMKKTGFHSTRFQNSRDLAKTSGPDNTQNSDYYTDNKGNGSLLVEREKRQEHNIVVDDAMDEENNSQWNNEDSFVQDFQKKEESQNNYVSSQFDEMIERSPKNVEKQLKFYSQTGEIYHPNNKKRSKSWSHTDENISGSSDTKNTDSNAWIQQKRKINIENERFRQSKSYESSENEFEMYEIGNPDLLYTVQLQLFEKLTAPEGKPVWNDLTKGKSASVSTLSPEWIGQDMNIRFRPTEWIPRVEFSLPVTSLCLFKASVPESEKSNEDAEKYIVVPREDILGLQNKDSYVQKRENVSDVPYSSELNEQSQLRPRRVVIRTSRAIYGSKDSLNISIKEGEQFLTLPVRQSHQAQIDLEARADENQLVLVGSSARIMTVVADSSRKTTTTLTIQATNTGLAAAKFRVVARDCGPEFMSFLNDVGEAFSEGPVLLPPRHTQSIRLELPNEIPADNAHCVASLLNDEDESVASREITIKKGDRCFCVWHCECVCLSEDPRLLCREMPEARQIAAGLTIRERVRSARSVCYHDVVAINMLVTALGVLITLLLFGLAKAVLGLLFRCIGSWGLHKIVQMPRKLDHYYESGLHDKCVIYDTEGWPVHPSTKERSVRLVSKCMEFILNIIFFLAAPCIVVYEILKDVCSRCSSKDPDEASECNPCTNDKHCYSSVNDIQGKRLRLKRRQRHGIRKWMTPAADDLSTNIWQEAVPGKKVIESMQPLLSRNREYCRGNQTVVQHSCVDSEGDDTEYVLMQIQKSKESLNVSVLWRFRLTNRTPPFPPEDVVKGD